MIGFDIKFLISIIILFLLLKIAFFLYSLSGDELPYQKEQAEHRKSRLPSKNKDSNLYTTEERLAIQAQLEYKTFLKERIISKITFFTIILAIIASYLIFTITFLANSYINEKIQVAKKGTIYIPDYDCKSKMKVKGVTDGEILADYKDQFYKYCVTEPNVHCYFNDVVFHKPYVNCRKFERLKIDPLATKIIENYPFKFFVKYL